MKLSFLLEQLSQGEFRQMALGGSEYSGILPENYHKVIPHINMGMIELHKRFNLKTKTVLIQQYEHISTYHLDPRYALTNTASTASPKYIVDTLYEPFVDKNEVICIERVLDENGSEYVLNDPQHPYSIFTPTPLSIQIPFNDGDNAMSIEYRAMPNVLSSTISNVEDQEVEIPITYLQPLLLFIAGRYLTTTGNLEQEQSGMAFLARYEAACVDIHNGGLTISINASNQKFEKNGWI